MILKIGQSLSSFVQDWFKPLAYAIILLRQEGLPCIFYGDYYGLTNENVPPKNEFLDLALWVRKHYVYGVRRDYLDDPNIIGWTLEGDITHPNSGVAVILTDNNGGAKQMNVGLNLANRILVDCTGNIKEPIYVDHEGNGIFYVNGGSVSIWIAKEPEV